MLLNVIDDLDFQETRKNVLKRISEYKYLLTLMPVRDEPKITQTFSFIPPSTNHTLTNVESAAYKNIEREKIFEKRNRVLQTMHEAIDHMPEDERYIIVKNYLNNESTIEIYMDLGISKTKFYEVKQDAIIRLAFYLEIEAYKE